MKKSAGRILLLIAVVSVALSGCNGVPDGVIEPERMAHLLADIHVGESVVESNSSAFPTDSAKRVFRQSIYERNGVTPAEVDSSLRWYGYNMDKYVEVYDRVIEILENRMATVQQRAGSTAAATAAVNGYVAMEGDSVDVWYDVRFRPFAATLPGDVVRFVFRNDPNWELGDVYTFKTKLIGNSKQASFTVAVDYDDGTVETASAGLIGDGWHEVKFALDTARTPREIYGTLQYVAAKNEVAFVDSISFIRTRWKPDKAPARQIMKLLQRKRHSDRFD